MNEPSMEIAAVPVTVINPDKSSALVEAFLSGRNALTIKAYRQDLADFTRFLNAGGIAEAARYVLSLAHGDANALVLGYKTRLVDRGLQAASINRRLSAVRALVRLARVLGVVTWALEIQNVRAESYRDLRGPGTVALRRVLAALKQREDPKAKRDRAIIRLLHDLGLRRGEVVSLDLEHVDLVVSTLSVLGKGRTQRVSLTLPPETNAALAVWLAFRGVDPGALFINFDRAGKGRRLSGTSVYRLTKKLGLGRPHGVRHLSITTALDLMNGDVRKVQKFSRHKDLRVVGTYDDSRTDMAGEVARIVAGNL